MTHSAKTTRRSQRKLYIELLKLNNCNLLQSKGNTHNILYRSKFIKSRASTKKNRHSLQLFVSSLETAET